ncbi:MAG: hypothetical protein MZV70_72975 [Desulfobacterales bacterium]|nr:hypothetical protein [Desulfobacterales bacterium]
MVPLQLWILMAAFFVAGMAPIIVLEIPSQASHLSQDEGHEGHRSGSSRNALRQTCRFNGQSRRK